MNVATVWSLRMHEECKLIILSRIAMHEGWPISSSLRHSDILIALALLDGGSIYCLPVQWSSIRLSKEHRADSFEDP